jgi:hypothetical protein
MELKEQLNEILKEYKEKNKKVKEAQEELNKVLSTTFNNGIKLLFEIYPQLKNIRWTQYTPYFNDGDTCTFSSDVCDCILNLPREDDYDSTEEYEEEYEKYKKEPWDYKTEEITDEIQNNIVDFLKEFDDEDYETMFGDHAEVFVTKDGIEVENYCHD